MKRHNLTVSEGIVPENTAAAEKPFFKDGAAAGGNKSAVTSDSAGNLAGRSIGDIAGSGAAGNPAGSGAENNDLLQVKDLSILYKTDLETVYAVNHISFSLKPGETLGLVGETGAGKTTTVLGLLGLLPERTGRITSGSILFDGQDTVKLKERELQKIRGQKISMIFQDPMTALNPVLTVGSQIAEALYLHNTEELTREQIERKVEETLEMVGIPKSRKDEYPYQFSGGMRQRVVIAIALVCNPLLLIADEPTTALDVTIQAQILSMICNLQRKYGTSVIMITHDLGVVAETCDKVAIMYAGEIVEYGSLENIFTGNEHHPYTAGLFGSIPNLTEESPRLHPIEGLMPDPTLQPEGCRFADRCARCMEICRKQKPPVWEKDGHRILCHAVKDGAVEHNAVRDNTLQNGTAKEDANRAGAEKNTAKKTVTKNTAAPDSSGKNTAAKNAAAGQTPERIQDKAQKHTQDPDSAAGGNLLDVRNLKKYFKTPSGMLHAVDDVSFLVPKGSTLGVVGESGCGKSTLGRTLLQLYKPTAGQVYFGGQEISSMSPKEFSKVRPGMQMIFQDPYSSLNGRMSVYQLIAEPLLINKLCKDRTEVERKVYEVMDTVGLAQRLLNSYPHELDGGRRQRIGIARALVLHPEFIVCDEPVSALDVSIQAQILNLLMDLQDQMDLTYLFITHDLSVVKHISDEIMVMYLGKCVEKAPAKEIFLHPTHPYTRGLLAAIPIPSIESKHKQRELMTGEVSNPVNPKPGCRFAARCQYATRECLEGDIPLKDTGNGHYVACIHA